MKQFERQSYDLKIAIRELKIKIIRKVITLNKNIKAQDNIIKALYKRLEASEQIESTNDLPKVMPLPSKSLKYYIYRLMPNLSKPVPRISNLSQLF
jgi:hypothetical protein